MFILHPFNREKYEQKEQSEITSALERVSQPPVHPA